jgi:hypothetical protein
VNGYIEGGYSVCLATLAIYAATLVRRERSLRRRLPEAPGETVVAGPDDACPPPGPPGAEGARDGADAGVGGL